MRSAEASRVSCVAMHVDDGFYAEWRPRMRASRYADGVVRSEDPASAAALLQDAERDWQLRLGRTSFLYPFYFSRVLDADQSKMQTSDQRSIRFDTYKNQTVLEITGNYYAAYSADVMEPYARLKQTFQQVVMPMLQVAVPHFPDDSAFSSFAIEVSHHVRQKIMGVSSEHPENVTVIIPVPSAQKLVDARTDDQKQAAILEAQVFLNGAPYSLWLQEVRLRRSGRKRPRRPGRRSKPPVETAPVTSSVPQTERIPPFPPA